MNLQLNDNARFQQSVDLELKLAEYTERFKNASDAVQSLMIQEINRELDKLENNSHAHIQDPRELTGRRTHRGGGPRRLTAAEKAEKELAKNDKSEKIGGNRTGSIVDLTTSTASQTSQQLAIENEPLLMRDDLDDMIVVAPWPREKGSPHSQRPRKRIKY